MAESDQISERSDGDSVEDVMNLSRTHSDDSMAARGRILGQSLTSRNGSDDETLSRSEDDGVDSVAFENASSSTLGLDQNSSQNEMLQLHMSEVMQLSDQGVMSHPEPEVAGHLDRVILDQINIPNELDNRTNDREPFGFSTLGNNYSYQRTWWRMILRVPVDRAPIFQKPTSRQKIAAALPISFVGKNEVSQNCGICLGEFESGEEIKHLPCKHFFHSECLNTWLSTHFTCPYCRSPCKSS